MKLDSKLMDNLSQLFHVEIKQKEKEHQPLNHSTNERQWGLFSQFQWRPTLQKKYSHYNIHNSLSWKIPWSTLLKTLWSLRGQVVLGWIYHIYSSSTKGHWQTWPISFPYYILAWNQTEKGSDNWFVPGFSGFVAWPPSQQPSQK